MGSSGVKDVGEVGRIVQSAYLELCHDTATGLIVWLRSLEAAGMNAVTSFSQLDYFPSTGDDPLLSPSLDL